MRRLRPVMAATGEGSCALWIYRDGDAAIRYRHPIDVGGITLSLDTTMTPGAYFAFTAPGGVHGLIMARILAGQWYHVALVGDSAGVRAYLNGSSIEQSPANPFALQLDLVTLGPRGASANWFDGRID